MNVKRLPLQLHYKIVDMQLLLIDVCIRIRYQKISVFYKCHSFHAHHRRKNLIFLSFHDSRMEPLRLQFSCILYYIILSNIQSKVTVLILSSEVPWNSKNINLIYEHLQFNYTYTASIRKPGQMSCRSTLSLSQPLCLPYTSVVATAESSQDNLNISSNF